MTREELRRHGIELHGPIVPRWFKKISDGCSVPYGLRLLLKAKQGRASCYIHDFRFFGLTLAYPPGSPMRNSWRMHADFELKQNRALSMKWEWLGRLYGSIYFRGVRIGGRKALKSRSELVKMTPRNIDELCELHHHITTTYSEYDTVWFYSIYHEMRDNLQGV